jgi:hypothetical protein
MIAATAASNDLSIYAADPDDFKGSGDLIEIVPAHGRPSRF